MALTLWEKIEYIRRQPEHIRMRYVVGCLSISMLFILGIWMLSIRQGFENVAKEVPQAVGNERTPSLNDMSQQSKTLRVEDKEKTGQQFFEEQLQTKKSAPEKASDRSQ